MTHSRQPPPADIPSSSRDDIPPPPASPPVIIRDPLLPDGAPDDPNLAVDPTPPRDWPDWATGRRADNSDQSRNTDTQTQQQGGVKKTLSFSNPKPGNFSYRRRRPDINALRKILTSIR